ncbi:MAG: bifunctional [glutamate--ammonia ligase]-adenylyl-L-tyrosine phosphorylase/[glutamate--ammonia-ligase] adenylyltransferase, partial [Kofleriaceae bacterium]|nr:bifunctional [glutamate--ammonia ligase]-adenylyl-L-tyrosine phosphorylase/[glutamate--ammonia-ligase] adenylyltransferase [Kofleriaceae bacterium]
ASGSAACCFFLRDHLIDAGFSVPGLQGAEELAELTEDIDELEQLDPALRHFRADELVRLGVRELELGTPFEVGEELSYLADICLDVAIAFHEKKLQKRYGKPLYEDADGVTKTASLSVIGMGKLGGLELNFSSDIDLIYVYTSDNGEAGDLSLQEYFAKLCRRVSSSIGDTSDEDCVFRVDLRLRPEGSKGAIANSLPSTEGYYESFGRPWKRQAWLKARPCAGDPDLGREVMSMMRPFIYPRSVSTSIIDDVRDLNQRIKSELTAGSVDTGYDLKNGVGGIREIEFFVQALQLIHAGRRPKLQTRSTIVALDELLFGGLITEEERHGLAEAYRYLRHLEHMVQLESGRQTQRLPTDPDAIDILAKRSLHTGAADLRQQLEAHTRFVQASFDTLGESDVQIPFEVTKLLTGRLGQEQEQELLAALGFRYPKQAWTDFDIARDHSRSPFGGAASGAALRVAPHLLREIATSPDPDQALWHCRELISRFGQWSSIWAMMADNPNLLRLIASVFGTSVYLSKRFISHPELFDFLLTAGSANAYCGREDLAESLAAREIDTTEDREDAWSALADYKNSEVLRIGLADIAGAIDPLEVCTQLSDVAELCVLAGLSLVRDDLLPRYGVLRDSEGEPVELTVLAMGKLGGRELGYASDLDLVFVYSSGGESDGKHELDAATYCSRIAQRLMRGLHSLHPGGRLYEIDTRLRPNGSKGLLVSGLPAWKQYHTTSARVWEQQSLTKLRTVAGSEHLGQKVEAVARECIYGERDFTDGFIASEIQTMRDRIWTELVAPQKKIDLKAGHGGLIDIEFTAQYLQLRHGAKYSELHTPSTIEALSQASALGLALEEDCQLLIEGYHFLRRLEHRLRIVHDRSEHYFPDDPIELDKLARRIGYPDSDLLREDLQRWKTDIHQAYKRILEN